MFRRKAIMDRNHDCFRACRQSARDHVLRVQVTQDETAAMEIAGDREGSAAFGRVDAHRHLSGWTGDGAVGH